MSAPRPASTRALLVWDTRRRLPRAAVVLALILGATLALGGLAARGRVERGRPVASGLAESVARSALERGDAHRRAGRTAAALEAYGEAVRDPFARADIRRKSRYGAARARLDAGEPSALEELARLAEVELAPHEIARAHAAILRFDATDERARARVERAAERCLDALRSRAIALDIDGVRARGWLARVEARARTR